MCLLDSGIPFGSIYAEMYMEATHGKGLVQVVWLVRSVLQSPVWSYGTGYGGRGGVTPIEEGRETRKMCFWCFSFLWCMLLSWGVPRCGHMQT